MGGFPTLKYGDPSFLEDYEGGREYEESNLRPMCSPSNLSLCSDAKKMEIEKRMNMTDDDLQAAIDIEEEKVKDAEAHFDEEVDKLQESFNKLMSQKDAVISQVKKDGLGIMKAVQSLKDMKKKKIGNGDETTA